MDKEKENFGQGREFSAWRPAAWLRVTGADATVFLQGQLTNDLRQLGATGAVYGLFLNHKGRVLADAFVLRGWEAGEFWVGSYFSRGAAIREHLEAFVIADDVSIEDQTGRWAGVAVWGEAPLPADVAVFEFSGRRSAAANREWVFPAEQAERVRAALAGRAELTADEVERRRIRGGIAAVPADIGPGELPNEGGLEAVAVSYTKGCYLGQEVMARLKSMGQVRRQLRRVRGRGPLPALPAALFQGDRKVGELKTAVADEGGFEGLALLTLLALQAETPLAWTASGEAVVAEEAIA